MSVSVCSCRSVYVASQSRQLNLGTELRSWGPQGSSNRAILSGAGYTISMAGHFILRWRSLFFLQVQQKGRLSEEDFASDKVLRIPLK